MIYIASDHAGFEVKPAIKKYLESKSYEFEDLGCESSESCAYSTYALEVAKKCSLDQEARGIIICGSGIGISMAANRISHVRAARCVTKSDAQMSRLHNNANVICLGSRVNSHSEIINMIDTFLTTSFEAGRHEDRVALFNSLGEPNI